MIVERHYDDETLIGLLATRASDVMRDPHLAACSSCADMLTSYRVISEVLADGVVWDLKELSAAPSADTLARLRAASRDVNAEDAEAAKLVNELMANPSAEWTRMLGEDARYHTLGVARRLVDLSEAVLDGDPPTALEVARCATQIADALVAHESTSGSLARARSAAWRQYANTLFRVGDLPGALAAVDRAEHWLSTASVVEYDLARIGIIRSVIYAVQDRYEEAIAVARKSAGVFRAFGDGKRLAAGLNAEAYALMIGCRYREALNILVEVDRCYREFLSPVDRAGLLGNIALCYWNTGRKADALQKYQLAAAAHAEIGAVAEVARIEFNVAGLLAAEGQHEAAKHRLRKVREEFKRLDMHLEFVSANLILAEVLLAEQAYEEVVDLCTACMDHYSRTGMSVDGLTALAYLQEAASHRRATPDVVSNVRRYVERLPHEPALLFARPPEMPG